jgi:hypothetical protein
LNSRPQTRRARRARPPLPSLASPTSLPRLHPRAQEWREAHAIDAILATPIPHFAAVKDAYLHAVVGRTRDGRAVLVEGMGSARAAVAKLKPQGVGPEDVVYQFIFTLEWMARVLDPGAAPAGRFVRIYDLKGVKFTDCADKVSAAMGREATQVLESHFPGRMDRAFIVNAPGFFNMLWKARPAGRRLRPALTAAANATDASTLALALAPPHHLFRSPLRARPRRWCPPRWRPRPRRASWWSRTPSRCWPSCGR